MADSDETTNITFGDTGALRVTNLKTLRNSKGEPFEPRPRMALCRCGASAKKPFCDGSHNKIEFDGAPGQPAAGDGVQDFAGKAITVHDNRATCAHIGICTDRLAAVFNSGGEPWIDPDGAAAAEVAEIVKACPSGALSYTLAGARLDDAGAEMEIQVSKDGPYYVTGGIPIDRGNRAQGASEQRYALCRCGASKNKPFCDGSHWAAEFSDPGE
ncbi:MAG: CDGSH iron-sulfur domain-containing protein [bacterium]